jgi:LCP family protein required for cell wall assembly
MSDTDNFKHPKQPHSKSRKHTDGFLHRPDHQNTGSIGFGQDKPRHADKLESNHIGSFDRPDGFHAGAQPFINTVPHQSNKGLISNEPRRRSPEEDTKKHRTKVKKSKKVRSRRYKIIKRSILAILAILILIGGFLGYKFWKNSSQIFGGGGIFGFFDSTKLKGEDQGRVNILLAGNSEDDPGHAGATLTDSIMLVSIDTVNNSGFMMSIPRDLWVTYGVKNCAVGLQGKINAAYVCGEQVKFNESGYPPGGMGLLEKIVERDFDVDIHYYAKINYKAFKDAVNAVGGIDITIKTNDPRGLYDGNIAKVDGGPLKLSNGVNHLNGQTALNLARARCEASCYGYTSGDFDRTNYQRQMLLALKDKALSVGVLSNPAKISSLLDAAGNNVKTDLKTGEARRLHDLVKKINNQSIKSIGLADNDVKLVQTASINGTSLVRPVAGLSDFSQIKAFMKKLTSNDPVVKEDPTAVVLNGSGKSGLAQRKANVLTDKGINIKAVANASKNRPATVVVMLNGGQKTATKAYLEQIFKTTVTTDTSTYTEANNYKVDFVIILGQNESE